MFSVAPNILLAPNMTQNAERKHRTQDANTAHNRLLILVKFSFRKARFNLREVILCELLSSQCYYLLIEENERPVEHTVKQFNLIKD